MRFARVDVGMGPLYIRRHCAASSRARDTKWRPSGSKPAEALKRIIVSVLDYLRSQKDGMYAYHAHVSVQSSNPFVCAGLQQLACDDFFDR